MVFYLENAQRNLRILHDLLGRISYKPGWKFKIFEVPDAAYTFVIEIQYDGYESEEAVFFPLRAEIPQVTRTRERLGISLGQTVRSPERRYFRKSFDLITLDQADESMLIKYIIAQTIKEAEMFEFDRWFKFEGMTIFRKEGE